MNFIAPLRCEMEIDRRPLQHVLPVPHPDFELNSGKWQCFIHIRRPHRIKESQAFEDLYTEIVPWSILAFILLQFFKN
jgi:hypothetical protein